MSALREYSPADVVVKLTAVGGRNDVVDITASFITVEGFSVDTMIETARSVENSEMIVGAQGDTMRVHSADKTGTISFMLMQTSETNEYLSYMQIKGDRQRKHATFNIDISDRSGGAIVRGIGCQIATPSGVVLGKGANDRTWVFNVENLEYLQVPAGITRSASDISRIEGVVDQMFNASNSLFKF